MAAYDLVVIGAGPAGYEAAIEAAKVFKMHVALVEKGELGGTCLNRGCIPTKTLLHTAELFETIREKGALFAFTGQENLSVSLSKLIERKDSVVSELQKGIATLLKMNKVEFFHGEATIRSACAVEVNGVILETKYILIATGSQAARVPIPGIDSKYILTSTEILDRKELPDSLIIIGGGVIGCEMASIFSALGTQVTIIEAMDRLLPNMDKEISRNLKMIFERTRGITVHLSSKVTAFEDKENGVTCSFEKKGEKECAESDLVLVAIGRRPNTEGLLGEDLQSLRSDRGYIAVDENFQTKIPAIYAAGDVTGGIQLAHAATAQALHAVWHMNGKERKASLDTIPSCIYTTPEIATVGLTADQAKAKGKDVITKKMPTSANGKSRISLEERGFVKIVVEKDSECVLGCQLMCARATDIIALCTQSVVSKLTLDELQKSIYAHPSYSEVIGEALR